MKNNYATLHDMHTFDTEQIISYYKHSNWLYSFFWYDRDSRGLHYSYTRTGKETFNDGLLSGYKDFLEWAQPIEGYRVLDAGCGVGGGALWMAQHNKGTYVGISITPRQIEEARKTRSTLDNDVKDRLEFEVMDFTRTSFESGSFDAVYGQESFCHTYPAPELLLSEMYRVLKQGGEILHG
jgi:SAM-dependent methyltransferase